MSFPTDIKETIIKKIFRKNLQKSLLVVPIVYPYSPHSTQKKMQSNEYLRAGKKLENKVSRKKFHFLCRWKITEIQICCGFEEYF